MIKSIAHVTVYVLNQDEALAFYRDKLGFEVGMDMTVEGGFRWLTIHTKAQPQLEMVLAEPKEGPMFTKDSAEKIRGLIEDGAFGVGVFETEDCQETYKELVAKALSSCNLRLNSFTALRPWGKTTLEIGLA